MKSCSEKSTIKNQQLKIKMSFPRMKKRDVERVAAVLNAGGAAVMPADTVYGVFCRADNKKAVEKIYRIKGRDFKKPLQVFFSSKKGIYKAAAVSGHGEKMVEKNLPGPYTMIFNIKKNPGSSFLKDTVGVRHIKYKWINDIIRLTGPLAATSANISGKKDPLRFSSVDKKIIEQADALVVCDRIVSGEASRVVSFIGGEPEILR
ncbi:MAG: L-threonylcarbamoyladenylate synthase [Candidatus Goldiibacteriota bacterium]